MLKFNAEAAPFTVRRDSAAAHSALTLLIMSLLLRLAGYWAAWSDTVDALLHLIVPTVFAVLYALCVFVFGKKLFRISSLPFIVLAVIGTIETSGSRAWWQIIVFIFLCLAATALYTCTAFGLLRARWVMAVGFALLLLARFFITDLPALRDTVDPASLTDGLRELSLLCILAAASLVGMALAPAAPAEEPELPTIKTPVVVSPTVQEGEFTELVTVLDDEDSHELTEYRDPSGKH